MRGVLICPTYVKDCKRMVISGYNFVDRNVLFHLFIVPKTFLILIH